MPLPKIFMKVQALWLPKSLRPRELKRLKAQRKAGPSFTMSDFRSATGKPVFNAQSAAPSVCFVCRAWLGRLASSAGKHKDIAWLQAATS